MPRVSVIIPTYNRAAYVCEAIDSVLAQTYRDFEIIVVDDGSTDSTGERLREYGSGIRYIPQTNAGECASRNTALTHAQGEYIAFLDDDDLFSPTNLEYQVGALEAVPKAGFAFARTTAFGDGNPPRWPVSEAIRAQPAIRSEDLFPELVLCNSRLSVPAVMVRQECFGSVGGFDERLMCAGDEEMWLRLAATYGGTFNDVCVAAVRRHTANVGKNGCRSGWYVEARRYVTRKMQSALPPPRQTPAVQELLAYRGDLIEIEESIRLFCLGDHAAAPATLKRALADDRWTVERIGQLLPQLGKAVALTVVIYGEVFDGGDRMYPSSTDLCHALWDNLPASRRYLRQFLAQHLWFRHEQRAWELGQRGPGLPMLREAVGALRYRQDLDAIRTTCAALAHSITRAHR